MTIIPLFLIMKALGWVDTHLAIIVPPALFNAFAVFLLRHFIRGIPKELEEAAMIDGCNRFRTYWQIILPLLVPAMSALGIFLFLGSWNSFFQPLILLNSPELFTVPLMLNQSAASTPSTGRCLWPARPSPSSPCWWSTSSASARSSRAS